MTEPRTEAGRALLAEHECVIEEPTEACLTLRAILAIEDEAARQSPASLRYHLSAVVAYVEDLDPSTHAECKPEDPCPIAAARAALSGAESPASLREVIEQAEAHADVAGDNGNMAYVPAGVLREWATTLRALSGAESPASWSDELTVRLRAAEAVVEASKAVAWLAPEEDMRGFRRKQKALRDALNAWELLR